MTNSLLKARLGPVVRRQRRLQLLVRLAACWGAAALAGLALLLLQRLGGFGSPLVFPVLALAGLVASLLVAIRHWRTPPDLRAVARSIERSHPELHGLLLTVVQQEPDAAGQFNFLQQRVLQEAVEHSLGHRWTRAVSGWQLGGAHLLHLALLVAFVAVLAGLRVPHNAKAPSRLKLAFTGIEVTPGEVSIEKGSSLVVLARFGTPPKEAELVITETPGTARRMPLTRSLADPVFGGSVPDVSSNFLYHVEYGSERTRDFAVKVFEYPRLERADVDLTYPAYTGLPVKHIEDTRRVSAVEGTHLDLALQLNHPVVSAVLMPRGTSAEPVPLLFSTNQPSASLTNFALTASATYDLRLVDGEGRTNKLLTQFVFDALPNRTPELKLASPRGDQRPSALEEISFTGTVWDDFGIPAYGIAFTQVGQETKFVELGHDVTGKERRSFQHLLKLEDLGAQPDQVIAWFVWADDIGPDGQVRRTTGDLYFGEVRPFDEVFREAEGGGNQEGGGGQDGQRNPTTKLAELQKQIINATWRLQRDHSSKAGKKEPQAKPAPAVKGSAASEATDAQSPIAASHRLLPVSAQFMGQSAGSSAGDSATPNPARARRRTGASGQPNKSAAPGRYEDDLAVIRESAEQAIEQAKGTMEGQQAPRAKTLWSAAIAQMERSLEELDKAKGSPAALSDALVAEEAAYQALLKLQARETSVTRARNRSQGQGQNDQRNQRQIDELELTQSENHYETQRQAQAPQNQERREQLQVMNRLQELARRQQDVNERLKELQTALQEAKSEKERGEIRRQLKRLQEEQKQQLADVDELQQRMNRPENQSRMDEQRKQLDQTRDELQQAAEATGDGQVSQALAAGTRAQRQLQDMRDNLRKQNSSEFAEDMRDMRAEARELARQQEELEKKLAAPDDSKRKTLSDPDAGGHKDVLDQLAKQKERMTNLVARATQMSQQAESSEPLLSRQLYDTVRKFSQDDANSVKQLQEELIRKNMMTRSMYDRLQEMSSSSDGAKSLELTAEMLRQGQEGAAGAAERRARASIDTLKQGVERAAEKVLGDDTEALRLAQQELESLTQQLERELAKATGGAMGSTNATAQAQGQGGQRQPGGNPGEQSGADGERPQLAGGGQPGTTPQPSPEGQGPGQGRQPGQSQSANAPNGQGQKAGESQQPGQGQQPGKGQGQGQGQGEGQQAQSSSPSQPAGQSGQGQGGGGGQQPGSPQRQQANQGQRGQRGQNAGESQGGQGGLDLERIMSGQRAGNGGGGGGGDAAGPITGEDFATWADRLRDVEEMVDAPDLRSSVANAREQARLMRLEFRRDLKKPDWANVQLKVVKPLVEVRSRIREELARRTTEDSLVPIDRDPVPNRYSELVRRYYEDLGKDK